MNTEGPRDSHEPRPAGEVAMGYLRLVRDRAQRRFEATGDSEDAPPGYVNEILELWERGDHDAARTLMTEHMEQLEEDEDVAAAIESDDPRLF